MDFLSRFTEPFYTLFRFMTGALFAFHGAQKLFGAFGGQRVSDPLMVAAGGIELVGGIMVAIGFLTPLAALLCSGEMAVAYFKAHAPGGFWPIENQGELAVIYCFAFLFIAARGSGPWSVDRIVGGKGRGSRRG
ncbi:MAG: DoxX family protein [Thermoanaerobaculia bacterium]